MLVAIHQPNFFPWLGFFDKLARADRFILLDSVAMQLTGGNYTNRVQVLVGGEARWITVPVERGAEARRRIDRLRIAEPSIWRRKILTTLRQSYAKARYFHAVMDVIEPVLNTETDLLCELNLRGIAAVAAMLGLPTADTVRASSLTAEGRATELLISLVRAVGGDTYLAGHGAGDYQDDRQFADAGIRLQYQEFKQTPYPQGQVCEFIPGLSAIDALMNLGPATASLIGSRATIAENV